MKIRGDYMIFYKAIADCKCEDEDVVTMKSEYMVGFKTAYSSFHIWKSDGYDILNARIEMFDDSRSEIVGTMNVDATKIM